MVARFAAAPPDPLAVCRAPEVAAPRSFGCVVGVLPIHWLEQALFGAGVGYEELAQTQGLAYVRHVIGFLAQAPVFCTMGSIRDVIPLTGGGGSGCWSGLSASRCAQGWLEGNGLWPWWATIKIGSVRQNGWV